MSGSFCVNSPPTSENNEKNNSSGTSTCNGGVHLCPFQLAPPINQYTYCILKRICHRILNEILSEERIGINSVENDLKIIQKGDNEKNTCPNDQQNPSSLESPLALKSHHNLSSNSTKIVQKSNKLTQTEQEFLNGGKEYNTNMKNHNFTKEMKKDFTKKNITIRSQLLKNGLPLIVNLRLQVRNGNMIDGSDS